jgi:hypothetical protein
MQVYVCLVWCAYVGKSLYLVHFVLNYGMTGSVKLCRWMEGHCPYLTNSLNSHNSSLTDRTSRLSLLIFLSYPTYKVWEK